MVAIGFTVELQKLCLCVDHYIINDQPKIGKWKICWVKCKDFNLTAINNTQAANIVVLMHEMRSLKLLVA